MTAPHEPALLLFGKPYDLEQQDCSDKFSRFATIALADTPTAYAVADDGPVAELATETGLLNGCCDAFSLIERESYDTRRVIRAVNNHLLQLLLHETTRRIEAIGFTAGMMFSNRFVPANTNAEAKASLNQCLGDACTLCLTLEQQIEQVAAARNTTAPLPEEAAALSLNRSKSRQNGS